MFNLVQKNSLFQYSIIYIKRKRFLFIKKLNKNNLEFLHKKLNFEYVNWNYKEQRL